jgi:hypothetical protein
MADQLENIDLQGREMHFQNILQELIEILEDPRTNLQNALQDLHDIQNLLQGISFRLQNGAPTNDQRELIRLVGIALANLENIPNGNQTAPNSRRATPISFSRRAMNAIVSKLASFSTALGNIARDMDHLPRQGGPIHAYLFPADPRVLLIDKKVPTEPHDEFIIYKEPFITTSHRSRFNALSSAAPPQTLDNDQHMLVPGSCRAIKLQPCGHVVGDVCFATWIRAPNLSFRGRCPYCQQQIGLKLPSLLRKVKSYFGTSWVLHFPDYVVATYFPRWMPEEPVANLEYKIQLMVAIGLYNHLWLRCLKACLQSLWEGNLPIVVLVCHCIFTCGVLLVPFVAAVLDHESLRLLQLVVSGIRWGVDWYGLERNIG